MMVRQKKEIFNIAHNLDWYSYLAMLQSKYEKTEGVLLFFSMSTITILIILYMANLYSLTLADIL